MGPSKVFPLHLPSASREYRHGASANKVGAWQGCWTRTIKRKIFTRQLSTDESKTKIDLPCHNWPINKDASDTKDFGKGGGAYTSNENPRTWRRDMGKSSFSQPRPRLISQMESVLHVSVRERAVALTWRVTLNPKKLNKDMLRQMASEEYRIAGELIIWYQPLGRSKKGDKALMDGIARIGTTRRIERVPKRPS